MQGDHVATAAGLERGLKGCHQVFSLFIDFQFAVTQDPEGEMFNQLMIREDRIHVEDDAIFKRDDAVALTRQVDETFHVARQQDDGVALTALGVLQHQIDPETPVRDERERMRRVDGHGRDHRQDFTFEILFHKGRFFGIEIILPDKRNPCP